MIAAVGSVAERSCHTRPVTDRRLVVVDVDDHDLFARGLALLLTTNAGDRFEVGGTTTHVEEAPALVESCAADLALVDLAMPPLGGAAAIRQIKRRHPATRVLALSGSDDLELAEQALRAGADGYLTKSADPEVLVAPLLTVAAGFRVLEGELLDVLLTTARKPPEALLDALDSQDLRLWALLARGLETQDIANRMLVSERTAKRMVASLLNRIGAANRVEAAGLAGAYGLLDQSPGECPQ
ncbi:response regulator transcription factor [Amycolatopsis methanolica]|uniref:response regulator transcription factor n=1 Tax=Amycolatopsis methanolica TaxID=1814 RepID=UPI000B181527|nr:response regulator transcription factor [Amycolatopsis methanolica]